MDIRYEDTKTNFVNMTMIFFMYTQNRTASTVLWLLRNINPFCKIREIPIYGKMVKS